MIYDNHRHVFTTPVVHVITAGRCTGRAIYALACVCGKEQGQDLIDAHEARMRAERYNLEHKENTPTRDPNERKINRGVSV